MYELKAIFDSRKSFYRKAHYSVVNGIAKLWSYDTLVSQATATNEGWEVEHLGKWSVTTSRHQREFENQLVKMGGLA